METKIIKGKIKCALYGEMTGIDCRYLQNKKCKGCIIYNSVKGLEKKSSKGSK